MEDRTVLKKMVVSTAAGLLFFITAMFTTMLDLSLVWRNIWLGFCIAFFLIAVGGVFVLCGDLNAEHTEPDDAKPNNSHWSILPEWSSWSSAVPCSGSLCCLFLGVPGAPGNVWNRAGESAGILSDLTVADSGAERGGGYPADPIGSR